MPKSEAPTKSKRIKFFILNYKQNSRELNLVSACQISKNRTYATKSHRFLFLLRFVHSFRLRFIHNGGYQQLRFVSGSSPAKTCTLVLSACQISKNRTYATKSHRFLFLLRFVHSFRLRFIHNGGYQQLRFVSGSSPAKTCTLVLSACQISKNRTYATKSHRFLFLLRFVHSASFSTPLHNGGLERFRF